MTPEYVGIILSAATLVVIAATATAAIVQLRHLRASNQLSALLEILNQWNQPAFQEAYTYFAHEFPKRLQDAEYVARVVGGDIDRGTHPELLIMDFWEQVGAYAKAGLVDESILLDIIASQVSRAYRTAQPMIEAIRSVGGPSAMENFEYLAVKAKRWIRAYPNGSYPPGLPRMKDLEADASI